MELNKIFHKSLRRHEHRQLITILSAVIATAAFFAVQASLSRYSEALSSEPLCGMEEHVHSDTCYDETGNLICTIPQHVHTEECYQDEVTVSKDTEPMENETENTADLQNLEIVCADDAGEILDLQNLSSGCITTGSVPVQTVKPARKMMKAASLRSQQNGIFDFGNCITHTVVSKDVNGQWVPSTEFDDNDHVRVSFDFTVPSGSMLNSNPVMEYQIPEGIYLLQDESGNVIEGGQEIGTYFISKDTGIITITYDISKINVENEFTGKVFFDGKVWCSESGSQRTITLPGGTTINVNPTASTHDIFTGKSLISFDPSANTATYKVTVSTTKGTGESIKIEDWIDTNGTGTGSYDGNTVSVKKIDTYNTETSINVNPSIGTGEIILDNLPALSAGERYELTYTIKNLTANGADGSGKLKNHAKATSGFIKYECTNEYEFQKTSIYKSGYYDSSINLIRWQIKINDNGSNIAGKTLTDNLPSGVEVVGNIRVQKNFVDYTDASPTVTNNTITFIVPENEAGDTAVYTLEYCTTVPEGSAPVDNTAVFDNKSSTATAYPQEQTLSVSKNWQNKEEIGNDLIKNNWTSSVTIPKEGISSSGLTLTDTILDPVNENNETASGAHYAVYSDLHSAIENQLYITGVNLESLIEQEYRVSEISDLQCSVVYYGMDGTALTGTIADDTKISKFAITVTPTGSEAVTKYNKLSLKSYSTIIDASLFTTGNQWTVQNKAASGDKETTANHVYSGQDGLKKLLMIDDSHSESGAYTFNYETVENKDFKLRYKVLIDRTKIADFSLTSEYAIDITDTLPEGTEYAEEGGLTAYFGRLDGTKATDLVYDNGLTYDIRQNNTVTYNATDNQLNVKIKSYDAVNSNVSIKAQLQDDLKYIILDYSIRITDPSLINGESSVSVYENSVSWGDETTSQKTTVTSESEKLWKTGIDTTRENDVLRRVHYQIVVNKEAADLNDTGDTILLTDTLSTNAHPSLNVNSLKVYRYSETAENHIGSALHQDYWSVEYDETNSKEIKITLPDEMPLVVVYDYMFDVNSTVADFGTDKVKVENSATINGVISHKTTNGIRATQSGVITEQQNIIIQKVDSNNVTERLTGAKFKLEYWDAESSTWKTENEAREAFYLEKRDANGNIVYKENGEVDWDYVWGSSTSVAEANHHLAQDRLYRLTEITSPNGYVESNSMYHFILKSSGETDEEAKTASGATTANVYPIHYFGSGGGNIIIKNTKKTSGIGVKKVWKNRDGEIVEAPDNRTVEIKLNQMVGRRQTATLKVTYNNTSEQRFTVPFESQVTLMIYKTAEQFANDKSVTIYAPSAPEDNKVSVLSMSKQSDGNYLGEYQTDPVYGETPITIDEPIAWLTLKENYSDDDYFFFKDSSTLAQYGNTITLPYNGKWSYYWDGLPTTDGQGNKYYYTIEEIGITGDDLSNYEVTYNSNMASLEPGTNEVITNQAKDTYIMPETGGKGIVLYRMAGVLILLTGGILLLRKGVRDP